jgi:hypothetical protein
MALALASQTGAVTVLSTLSLPSEGFFETVLSTYPLPSEGSFEFLHFRRIRVLENVN